MSRDPSNGSPDGPKSVGAYYTPTAAARILSDWALRCRGERALDPAAGDGVFIVEAARRSRELGGDACSVTGVEMRSDAARDAVARLRANGAEEARVVVGDFLAMRPSRWPAFDAVLGNPPFVRYQRQRRDHRRRAEAVAGDAGIRLDPLASSWVAFVLHATAFLRTRGRLALVLPSEVGHARYARAVIDHLRRHFAEVTFVLFESALFPSLDQGTVLLLADGRGEAFRGFWAARVASIAALEAGLDRLPRRALDVDALVRGEARLHHAWLPDEAAAVLNRLDAARSTSRLGELCNVSIGYVTGHNGFFHLSPAQAQQLGLGRQHLRPALFRSRALVGLHVTDADWCAGSDHGLSGYLLVPERGDDPAVAAYLASGAELGVPLRTKVRRRQPWYRVTRVEPPDLVLTAMSTGAPRLAVNASGAAVCNTLHAVNLLPDTPPELAEVLALASLTSLAELSAELEGHALGGGLLKLEPSEASRLRLPLPPLSGASWPGGGTPTPDTLAVDVAAADRALRSGDPAKARRIADAALLDGIPGVGQDGSAALGAAAERLRTVRRGRRATPA